MSSAATIDTGALRGTLRFHPRRVSNRALHSPAAALLCFVPIAGDPDLHPPGRRRAEMIRVRRVGVQCYLEHREKESILSRSSFDQLRANAMNALKLAAWKPWRLYWGKYSDSVAKPTRLTADTFAAMLEAYDEEPSEISIYAYLPVDTESLSSFPRSRSDTDSGGETSESESDESASGSESWCRSRESSLHRAFRDLLLTRHGEDRRCAICGVSWTVRALEATHIIAPELFVGGMPTTAMKAIGVLGPGMPSNGILLCHGFCNQMFEEFYLTVVEAAGECGELVVELGEQLLAESPMYRPLHGRRLVLPPEA